MRDNYTPTTEEVRAEYVANRGFRLPTYISPAAEFDRWLDAHDRDVAVKALEDARVRPEFTEYLPNDGEYEYTSASDCDGSNVMHWRRRPRHVGEIFPWEPATEEQHAAAIRKEAT